MFRWVYLCILFAGMLQQADALHLEPNKYQPFASLLKQLLVGLKQQPDVTEQVSILQGVVDSLDTEQGVKDLERIRPFIEYMSDHYLTDEDAWMHMTPTGHVEELASLNGVLADAGMTESMFKIADTDHNGGMGAIELPTYIGAMGVLLATSLQTPTPLIPTSYLEKENFMQCWLQSDDKGSCFTELEERGSSLAKVRYLAHPMHDQLSKTNYTKMISTYMQGFADMIDGVAYRDSVTEGREYWDEFNQLRVFIDTIVGRFRKLEALNVDQIKSNKLKLLNALEGNDGGDKELSLDGLLKDAGMTDRMFQLADADNSGKLDRHELVGFLVSAVDYLAIEAYARIPLVPLDYDALTYMGMLRELYLEGKDRNDPSQNRLEF